MAPSGNALALLGDLLAAKKKRVMVVGHEPDLSTLVQRLVVGGLSVNDTNIDLAFERTGDRVKIVPLGSVPCPLRILVRA